MSVSKDLSEAGARWACLALNLSFKLVREIIFRKLNSFHLSTDSLGCHAIASRPGEPRWRRKKSNRSDDMFIADLPLLIAFV